MRVSRPQLESITGRHLRFAEKRGGVLLATARHDPEAGDAEQDVEGSPYEWFQIFDRNDEPYLIDGNVTVMYRGECHGRGRIPGVYHRGTAVWLVDERDRLLAPIRSQRKDVHPGKRDNSVGEHNNVGESYLDAAVRGLAEELFLDLRPEDLAFVLKLPMRTEDQWQMSQYFTCRIDSNQITGSNAEVAELDWLPIDELADGDPLADLDFRPDHRQALELFIGRYLAGSFPV